MMDMFCLKCRSRFEAGYYSFIGGVIYCPDCESSDVMDLSVTHPDDMPREALVSEEDDVWEEDDIPTGGEWG